MKTTCLHFEKRNMFLSSSRDSALIRIAWTDNAMRTNTTHFQALGLVVPFSPFSVNMLSLERLKLNRWRKFWRWENWLWRTILCYFCYNSVSGYAIIRWTELYLLEKKWRNSYSLFFQFLRAGSPQLRKWIGAPDQLPEVGGDGQQDEDEKSGTNLSSFKVNRPPVQI